MSAILKTRYHLLDALRGLALVNMIAYHFLWEHILRQLVKRINLHRRNAVLVENLTHSNTLTNGVALDFVVVGYDSIKYCVLNLLLLRLGCGLALAAR